MFHNKAVVSVGIYFSVRCCQTGGFIAIQQTGKLVHNMNQLFVINFLRVIFCCIKS